MITETHQVSGQPVTINWVNTPDEDMHQIQLGSGVIALDTETTGLDIYNPDFRLRTIQLGNPNTAYVFPVEIYTQRQTQQVLGLISSRKQIVIQNAAFDTQVLKQTLGYEIPWEHIRDTQILANLVDPRDKKAGGTGDSLEELTRKHIDPKIADKVKTSMKRMAEENKMTIGEVFKNIPIDDKLYVTYAGMDVILTSRLYQKLRPLIPKVSEPLIQREHELARICTRIQENGFLVDVDYTTRLSAQLKADADYYQAVALLEWGIEKINSAEDVAGAFEMEGITNWKLSDKTGKPLINKDFLKPLKEKNNRLAWVVHEAKKADKWNKTWAQKFLDDRDPNDRIHASINPLKARTGRMSITGVPAQTLPAKDALIRDCFIADPGHVIVSCDYQAQELRVLAALSGDKTMREAFANNADLHQMTADAAGLTRDVGKMQNFATVYGIGAAQLAANAGITVSKARNAMKQFNKLYPGVKQYSQTLAQAAGSQGYVITPYGRRLPVDKDRVYSALNYMVQSTSRDITVDAILRLDEEGFTDYIRLPIHDEMLSSIPEKHKEWGSKRIAELMAADLNGVHIGTDRDIFGRSWGDGYKKKH